MEQLQQQCCNLTRQAKSSQTAKVAVILHLCLLIIVSLQEFSSIHINFLLVAIAVVVSTTLDWWKISNETDEQEHVDDALG